MRVAMAQCTSGDDVGSNLTMVAGQVAAAVREGAELVVFPEATMCAFGHRLDTVAEPLFGPFGSAVADLARRHAVTIVVGMFTPGSTLSGQGRPKVRNTALIASPDGRWGYDKIHLFDAFSFAESDTVEFGDDPVVVDVAGVRVGVAICYDVRFPRLFTALAARGAEAIVVPTSWQAGPGKLHQWRTLVTARALDSTCYVFGVGQADPETAGVDAVPGAPTGVGHSLAVAPDGRVLAELGPQPGLVVVDVDPEVVAATRASLPVLANARDVR